MKPEDLTPENVGRKVRVYLNGNFNDARATFRAWSKDHKTVIVSLDSEYGKGFRSGTLIELPIASVRFVESSSPSGRGIKGEGASATP